MATNNRFITSYNGLTGVYYPSESGLVDIRSGQPYVGGGLYLGAVSELTFKEAASLSLNQAIPIYAGRYRFVAIDPGATAANLAFGRAVAWRPGTKVATVAIVTAGSGQTPGTFTATANAGGAVIQYVITGAGVLGAVSVLSGGTYVTGDAIPTFTIASGGTPGTVAAELDVNPNEITSMDVGVGGSGTAPPRGVILGGPPTASDLANPAYAWIVENGTANVLGSAAAGGAAGTFVNATSNGTVATSGTFGPTTLGYALDAGLESALYRVQLTLPNFGG